MSQGFYWPNTAKRFDNVFVTIHTPKKTEFNALGPTDRDY
jgi:hypothetical protein